MRTKPYLGPLSVLAIFIALVACTDRAADAATPTINAKYGGYESPEMWGEHLVTIS